MTDKLFETYLRKQLAVGMINENDISVFRYGYTLLTEVFINFVISILIGIILGDVLMVVAFLLAFIPLRSFAGGYHADKAWKCILLTNVAITVAILFNRYMCTIVHAEFLVLLEIVLGLIILKLAPIQSANKPLSAIEVAFYKKMVFLIYIIEILEEVISFLFAYKDIAGIILIVHAVIIISLIAGNLNEKKVNEVAG
jgi:Membrane protein putatively involved in post-translational modification of the autoinducing quorum-sensing peptide